MSPKLVPRAVSIGSACWRGARQFCRELCRCRECQAEVRFLEECCPTCGAFSPVRIPYFVTLAIGLFSFGAVLLISWL